VERIFIWIRNQKYLISNLLSLSRFWQELSPSSLFSIDLSLLSSPHQFIKDSWLVMIYASWFLLLLPQETTRSFGYFHYFPASPREVYEARIWLWIMWKI
jgi:hypothetical protein